MKHPHLCVLLFVPVLLAACRWQRAYVAERESAMARSMSQPEEDEILFVAGEMSYDSISNAYTMKVAKQQRFVGRMNLDAAAVDALPEGLCYMQVDASEVVLSRHVMDNPLRTEMEYADGDRLYRKTVVRPRGDFFLRIQLNPRASKIVFRNGKDVIETLKIER